MLNQCFNILKVNQYTEAFQKIIAGLRGLHRHMQFIRMAVDVCTTARVVMNGMSRFEPENFCNGKHGLVSDWWKNLHESGKAHKRHGQNTGSDQRCRYALHILGKIGRIELFAQTGEHGNGECKPYGIADGKNYTLQ